MILLEEPKVKKSGGITSAFSVLWMLFFMVSPFFEDRARGETDYMQELSIVRFDEKVKAQNFILKDLNGSEVSLEDYRGKVILINFWATWCLPCRIEMPLISRRMPAV
jgi:thiol-disulfide isomerase/thioredoxin